VEPAQSIFFWCCKSLGLKCVQSLVATLAEPQWAGVKLVGVAVSSRDEWADEIRAVAKEVGAEVVVDLEPWSGEVDLGLCVAFPHKLAGQVLSQCRLGVVNLHFAPLPEFRGSGTLEQAIAQGVAEYGVSLHVMAESLDTGPVIVVERRPLPAGKTTSEVGPLFEELGLQVFDEWLPRLLRWEVELVEQDKLPGSVGFYTKKMVNELAELPVGVSWAEVLRRTLALSNGKGLRPYMEIGGRRLYVSLE
jgi:methionyl-tRNA formyltransferase